MASFEITGNLKVKNNTQNVSDKFSKREFVLETDSETQYPQYLSFQLTQDKCPLLDSYNVGDSMKVSFNMRGREWTAPDGITKYFNSLEAWRIEKLGNNAANSSAPSNHTATQSPTPAQQQDTIGSSEPTDDLPF